MFFFCLFNFETERERERERAQVVDEQRGRERERERIPGRFCIVSAEPDARLEPMNCEIMT